MKKICVLLAALLLLPTLAYGEAYTIGEVREQVEALGRWRQTYTDDYGREVEVDVAPIVPDVDVVPVLTAQHAPLTEENVGLALDVERAKVEETERYISWYDEDEETGEQVGVTIITAMGDTVQLELDHANRKRSNSKQIESSEESYFCSNEVDEQRPYLGEGLPNVRTCMDDVFAQVNAFYPEDELQFELIWLDTVVSSRPYYRCVLRQQVQGIPVLMGAQDPVHNIRQKLDFDRPSSWAYEEGCRWGDFTRPFWELDVYADGGFVLMLSPLRATGARADDVPLCGMDQVIESIRERIEAGYIRHVYALRLGYCCYPSEGDEIVLYPVWMVECRYIYNPEEGKAYSRKRDDVPYTNELDYHTMIVNAQTGEFMDPIELRENLLDCPEIITWEDVQA